MDVTQKNNESEPTRILIARCLLCDATLRCPDGVDWFWPTSDEAKAFKAEHLPHASEKTFGFEIVWDPPLQTDEPKDNDSQSLAKFLKEHADTNGVVLMGDGYNPPVVTMQLAALEENQSDRS